MAVYIEKLHLEIDIDSRTITCWYKGLDADGNEVGVNSRWAIYLEIGDVVDPEGFQALMKRIQPFLSAVESLHALEPLDLEIQGARTQVEAVIERVHYEDGKLMLGVTWPGTGQEEHLHFDRTDLPPGHQRLLDSLIATIERKSWEDLRASVSAPARRRFRVFISYRSGHEAFAEALAKRLGQEGIEPWFDRWDVRAGDSVPGKIEEGFRESQAFIPILTADYEQGKWATDELMTAITKRLEEGYRIVPVLLEDCDRPELIRQLHYVDLSAQDPQTYETKIAELIDGIYGLELNPFR